MDYADLLSIPGATLLLSYLDSAREALHNRISEMIAPLFLVFVAIVLILERLVPAKPEQKILSVSKAQDIVWFLIQAMAEVTLLSAWVTVLSRFYEQYLSFLTVEPIAALPYWLSVVLAVVFVDFLRWGQHIVQHKVPWFWQFHAIHHSQKNISLFTDFRYHPFEYLVKHGVMFVPLLMFGVKWPDVVWLSILLYWHARLYHSNVRMNFGFFRYIIVTPQSHRVHHSIERQHQDKNYGAFLSIWDWIFATQYRGHEEYPDTGISDQDFPHEKSIHGLQLITTPIRQMIYPFTVIGRSLRPARHPKRER